MPFFRPKLARTTSAPASQFGVQVPVREQTLRTLQMLKTMGYSEVWCKAAEVDENTIDQAELEGWRVCDVKDERIKFTQRPRTPQAAAARFRPPEQQDEYRRGSVRTVSPTRLAPEPQPSPLAQYRRATESNITPPGEPRTRRPTEATVQWGRRPSAEPPPMAPPTPSVVLTPAGREPDEVVFAGDYFTFVPVSVPDMDDFVMPQGSWLQRRAEAARLRPDSGPSEYSLPSIEESNFEFDESDPFGTAQPPLPSPSLEPPMRNLRQTFRPKTPELRIPVVARARAGSAQLEATPIERPTYTLNRVLSDPGVGADAGPDFELLPLLPPRWRCRDT